MYATMYANVQMYAQLLKKNERKIPMRASRGLKWEKENEKAKKVYWTNVC